MEKKMMKMMKVETLFSKGILFMNSLNEKRRIKR
jgi:hypothetical protein